MSPVKQKSKPRDSFSFGVKELNHVSPALPAVNLFKISSCACYWVAALILLPSVDLHSQDLEQLGQQKWLTYSGSISTTNTFYHVQGVPSRRDPYFWQLNANLNFNILGIINAPFAVTFSQQNKSFAQPQPFNRFGISPTYKGLTVHLGHRSINFSDYTLAGNLFFGVGVEYKPEESPLRVAVMYGRFAKPVDKFTQLGQVYAEPTYRRLGYGMKVGYEEENRQAAVMFFRAADDINSISAPDTLFTGQQPSPEENLVIGFEGGFKFLERFSFSSEYAYSLFTRDRRMPELFTNDYSFINNLGGLYTPNASSAFTNAFKSQLTFQGDMFQLNLNYRRVDPGYTTHGSSFLNNDLEDITAGISIPVFQNKVNLSVNGGLQHNNIDQLNSAEVRRAIFSSSASVSASDRLNINLNVANFSTSTRQMLIQSDILSDTLAFYQVTKSAMTAVNYTTGAEGNQGALFVTANFQDASDNQGNSSEFKSANAGYSFKLGEVWSANASFTTNHSKAADFANLTLGPVLGINRAFLDNKLRSNLSFSTLNSYLNGAAESFINNIRWSANWSPAKRHTLSMNTFYILKNAKSSEGQSMQEIRATLNYAFRI